MEKHSVKNSRFSGKVKVFFPVIIIICLLYSHCNGQDWQSVGSGFDSEVRCLYADTIDNILYCGGSFKMSGGLKVRGISKWNGVHWDSLRSGFDDYNSSYPNPTNTITRFHNTIFVGGAFSTAGGIPSSYIARWNGINWDSLTCFPNKTIINFEILDSDLYAMSAVTNICSQPCGLIAKYDGFNWIGIDYDTDTSFGNVSALSVYMGFHFVAGNLLPIRDIFMWDGSQSIQLGQGILGSGSYITSMVVYQNELYVAGKFSILDGNIGDNIMKWDGTNWSSVGGGLNQQVEELKVYRGYLYAVGIFDHAGGIPASCIARWDGNVWSALGTHNFDNGIGCIEFFNDELYVGGGFLHIDTLSVNRIAKYSGPLSLGEFSKPVVSFSVSPNPTNSLINLYFSSPLIENSYLTITDLSNRKLKTETIIENSISKEIDISEFAAGIYLITFQNQSGRLTKKLIKL